MRHLRSVFDVQSREVLEAILHRSQVLKRARRERRLAPTLAGRVVALLFERESTRTRLSFESGASMLGASALTMQSRDTQLSQGEPFRDAARVIGRYVDALITRTLAHDTVEEYARHARIPVINGLSDLDHPCQALTDVFTVYERREAPFDLKWAWVGDASPLANGYVGLSALTGLELSVAIPEGTKLDEGFLGRAREAGAKLEVGHDPAKAVAGAHVVATAAFSGEPSADVLERFRVDAELLAKAAEDAFVLHSLPARRGQEITDDVLEGRQSLAFEQAGNRLPVQQAILEWVFEIPGAA